MKQMFYASAFCPLDCLTKTRITAKNNTKTDLTKNVLKSRCSWATMLLATHVLGAKWDEPRNKWRTPPYIPPQTCISWSQDQGQGQRSRLRSNSIGTCNAGTRGAQRAAYKMLSFCAQRFALLFCNFIFERAHYGSSELAAYLTEHLPEDLGRGGPKGRGRRAV